MIIKGYLMMDDKVAKLIEKLRNKYPEQLQKDPLFDALEEEIVGVDEEEMPEDDMGEDDEGVTEPGDMIGINSDKELDEDEEDDLML